MSEASEARRLPPPTLDTMHDCVGGPDGWDAYAIAQGWDTVAGVRRLLAGKVRAEMQEASLRHALDYLTNTSRGLIADAQRLKEENARLVEKNNRLMGLRDA